MANALMAFQTWGGKVTGRAAGRCPPCTMNLMKRYISGATAVTVNPRAKWLREFRPLRLWASACGPQPVGLSLWAAGSSGEASAKFLRLWPVEAHRGNPSLLNSHILSSTINSNIERK